MEKRDKYSGYTQQEWEDLCDRCGRCCYEKYEYRNKIFYTMTPCHYLDTSTNLCSVYSCRFKENPECALVTAEIVRAGILPQDCPYVLALKKC